MCQAQALCGCDPVLHAATRHREGPVGSTWLSSFLISPTKREDWVRALRGYQEGCGEGGESHCRQGSAWTQQGMVHRDQPGHLSWWEKRIEIFPGQLGMSFHYSFAQNRNIFQNQI